MKHILSLMLSLCMALMLFTGGTNTVLADNNTFTDVSSAYWAYDSISYCAAYGLINGVGNGQFAPEKTLSYAEFITMMVRMSSGWMSKEDFNSHYPQKPGTAWWYPYMTYAEMKDYLTNTAVASQNFSWTEAQVSKPINRYDMALIVDNMMKRETSVIRGYNWGFNYPDAEIIEAAKLKIGDLDSMLPKYQTPVAVCIAMGIINGVNDRGDFSGNTYVTRAQAAAILQRCHHMYFDLSGNRELPSVFVGGQSPQTSPEPVPQPTTPVTPSTSTGTKWGKDSARYPTVGITATTPNKNGFYTAANVNIKENTVLVYELLDLINAERAKYGLLPYGWAGGYYDQLDYMKVKLAEYNDNCIASNRYAVSPFHWANNYYRNSDEFISYDNAVVDNYDGSVGFDELEEYALLRASDSYALYYHEDFEWVHNLWEKFTGDRNSTRYPGRGMAHYCPDGHGSVASAEIWCSIGFASDDLSKDAQKAFKQWMDSPSHKDIIMRDFEAGYPQYIVATRCRDCFIVDFYRVNGVFGNGGGVGEGIADSDWISLTRSRDDLGGGSMTSNNYSGWVYPFVHP